RSITRTLVNESGELPVITLDPRWESRLNESMVRSESGTYLALDAKTFEQLVHALSDVCQKKMASQWTLLGSSGLHFHVLTLIECFVPSVEAIYPNDIPRNVQIVSLGVAGQ